MVAKNISLMHWISWCFQTLWVNVCLRTCQQSLFMLRHVKLCAMKWTCRHQHNFFCVKYFEAWYFVLYFVFFCFLRLHLNKHGWARHHMAILNVPKPRFLSCRINTCNVAATCQYVVFFSVLLSKADHEQANFVFGMQNLWKF